MKLYTYFRSSAVYRVRIALNLKGLPYEAVPVHLLKGGGEQLGETYRALNPSKAIPALDDEGHIVTQSLAILEYLEETHPQAALLPPDPLGRARVRALAQMVACDIHPLTNLRVLRHLVHTLGISDEAKNDWYVHWVREGLATIEAHLNHAPGTGQFCHGDSPGMADCCLVPQVFNARRFNIDMAAYPTIARIDAACVQLPAFAAAHPGVQPDAE